MKELINDRVHDYYWSQDLNCAITTLKTLSELFDTSLHPQILQAAFGLNAGRLGTQCGLVEGGLMFLGIYGSKCGLIEAELKQLCNDYSNGFKQKFNSLLCKELRPQGFSPDNPPHLCENITKLGIIFTAEFISSHFK